MHDVYQVSIDEIIDMHDVYKVSIDEIIHIHDVYKVSIDEIIHIHDVYKVSIDEIIHIHDVYKVNIDFKSQNQLTCILQVETIGDAYMVVSGAPERNGDKHILEIANTALELLEKIHLFRMRERKDVKIKLRSGIHSGPCAAGI